jgi:hypothetical protein
MRRRLFVLLVLFAAAGFAGAGAQAQGFEITPYVGYRWTPHYSDFYYYGAQSLDLEDSSTLGIILTLDLQHRYQVEFMYGHQSTHLQGGGPYYYPSDASLFDINVDNWMLGWSYTGGRPRDQARWYAGVMFGVTTLDPPTTGVHSDSGFAFGLYGGVKVAMAKHAGLRLQWDWVTSSINSFGQTFCDPFGYCYTVATATYLNQIDLSAGLTIKF